ncbi:MAG: sensor histidine kinase [bacterium]|nr:sensor histidine kinase [bacterium]
MIYLASYSVGLINDQYRMWIESTIARLNYRIGSEIKNVENICKTYAKSRDLLFLYKFYAVDDFLDHKVRAELKKYIKEDGIFKAIILTGYGEILFEEHQEKYTDTKPESLSGIMNFSSNSSIEFEDYQYVIRTIFPIESVNMESGYLILYKLVSIELFKEFSEDFYIFITRHGIKQMGYGDIFYEETNLTLEEDDRYNLINIDNFRGETIGKIVLVSITNKYKRLEQVTVLTIIFVFFSSAVLMFIFKFLINKNIDKQLEWVEKDHKNAIILTQEKEREMIAYDLHDDIVQRLSYIAMTVENIMIDEEMDRDNLEMQNNILKETVGDIRGISYGLRPANLEAYGLENSLKDLIKRYEKDFKTNLSVIGLPDLEKLFSLNIYRIIQEGLNNIKKHAKAEKAEIKILTISKKRLIVKIEDDGIGFDIDILNKDNGKNNVGLIGMKERVKIFDGLFKIESENGKGTRIQADFDLEGGQYEDCHNS